MCDICLSRPWIVRAGRTPGEEKRDEEEEEEEGEAINERFLYGLFFPFGPSSL